MFDIGSTELLLIVIIAVIVIGPKDLPRALYKVGQVIGKARGMARHFRTGIDAMVREVEVEELEKKWADQNRRIMQEHPAEPSFAPAMEPLSAPAPATSAAEAPPPPFVAQSAPAAPEPKPAAAADGPPYIAAQSATGKGDAPA
ncbi:MULTISPECIES: Sec-independent protein translocase protein TatB [Sphingobium]|uniref:Sec-independent protein translocase protein TatB n=1 Tax=Sphingobium sp. MI1205 TaxID=407020 RepID=UPI0007706BBE|nr:Sec-independent protein translocase protein TatB [Sphingobium sp. MI1205]AMK18808.1 twin-arginine translocation protein TatB subunit [Sphingobium sp. MI1205]